MGIDDPSLFQTRTEKIGGTFTLIGVQRLTKSSSSLQSVVCVVCMRMKAMPSVDRLGEVHTIEYSTPLATDFAYLPAYSARVGGEVLQSPHCNRWIERSRNQISQTGIMDS